MKIRTEVVKWRGGGKTYMLHLGANWVLAIGTFLGNMVSGVFVNTLMWRQRFISIRIITGGKWNNNRDWIPYVETHIYLRFGQWLTNIWEKDKKRLVFAIQMDSEHVYRFVWWLIRRTGIESCWLWEMDEYEPDGMGGSAPWHASYRLLWHKGLIV